MYRALYAHNSKLPKYLSFEAGDKFTLIDTSISDQWFLAQNGMGQIGYVPFNYIKKIDVNTEQVVKFIDGSIEAIHLQAGADGASYTQEQRIILKKLMKHRSDVIKRATLREKSPKGASRRRPAPAPPVEKSSSVDSHHPSAGDRPANLAVVGRSATIATSTTSANQKPASEPQASKNQSDRDDGKMPNTTTVHQDAAAKSHQRSSSIVSDNTATSSHSGNTTDDVRKSRSVTSSIGQAPSIVSSASSLSTDIDADASNSVSSGDDLTTINNEMKTPTPTPGPFPTSTKDEDIMGFPSASRVTTEPSDYNYDADRPCEIDVLTAGAGVDKITMSTLHYNDSDTNNLGEVALTLADTDQSSLNAASKNESSIYGQSGLPSSERGTITNADDHVSDQMDMYDLPPPPPDLQSDDTNYDYFNSYSLPPAPDDDNDDDYGGMRRGMENAGNVVTRTSVVGEDSDDDESDSLDLPTSKAIRECSCDDSQSKFDPDTPFIASGSLQLPKGRGMDTRSNQKRDVSSVHQVLASSNIRFSPSADPDQQEIEVARLEQIQAQLGVTVTHADCEEMIGQFRHVSQLSHEESHLALLSAMGLLAGYLPHIKPSLEVLAHRFNMANQCPSTGKDYQCEDAVTLQGLVSQLDSVTNDSQQRGHYLRDDLDTIIDIITTLSDTLSKAKHCVSVAAIQDDNYAMIEVIARYYQMETRWLIHSCLLQLVETVCHLHVQAITEFLYSQLPLELVAEMQQHSNDDIRFLQVARSLGIVFMRGKASPHKLTITMDLHFFIWLLGMIEGFNERCRHDDVEMLVALVCAYHLQHRDDPQNPVTEALKMAQGHALLECSLSFLSKHDDPTRLLNSGIVPKLNSVVLLLTHLYDSSDTSDLLYTNDVEALIGIFQQVFRDLSPNESLHKQMLKLLYNFLRCYPDTVSIKSCVSTRLGHLLHNMEDRQGMAQNILEHNRHIFDEA